jgi:hypothetical protein
LAIAILYHQTEESAKKGKINLSKSIKETEKGPTAATHADAR